MLKNPITKIQETEDTEPKKTKRNKKATTCSDKRKEYGSCGICGSRNLASEGVKYCNICGEEVPFLVEGSGLWSIIRGRYEEKEEPKCTCVKIEHGFKRIRQNHSFVSVPHTWKVRDIKEMQVTHCLDCEAVSRNGCPACGNRVWAKGFQRYCKHCGFRQ